MSEKIKKNLEVILAYLLIWCAVGFLAGMGITYDERTSASKPSDGCTYRSFAPYTNPGYLISCELFRARFEHHSVLNRAEPLK